MAFEFIYDKLPAGVTRAAYPLDRYERARSWGHTGHRYRRTLSFPLACTADQHARLYTIAEKATVGARAGVNMILGALPSPVAMLPAATIRGFMETVDAALREKGFTDVTGFEYVAATRACAYAIHNCGTYLKMGRRPVVKFRVEEPVAWALPVRLAVGAAYARPIGVTPGEGGAWLALGDLGTVWCAGDLGGLGVDLAAYAEYTFWDRAWRLRFIFAEAIPAAERAARGKRSIK